MLKNLYLHILCAIKAGYKFLYRIVPHTVLRIAPFFRLYRKKLFTLHLTCFIVCALSVCVRYTHDLHSQVHISSGVTQPHNMHTTMQSLPPKTEMPRPELILSLLLPRLLCASRPLASRLEVEHHPLHRSDPLLKAGGAGPWEARRGFEDTRQRCLWQARITIMVDSRAKTTR